nr:MAG: hypothetical protein [Microviridae sp.]
MEQKEFREQVLNLQEEITKTGFKWENVFRAQVINEERTEWVIMIGDKLASRELFANEEKVKEYIEKKPWELIAALICSITENAMKEKLSNNKK